MTGLCDYCKLEKIKQQAKREHKQITMTSLGYGTHVYLHPIGIEPTVTYSNMQKFWVDWLFSMPIKCTCKG